VTDVLRLLRDRADAREPVYTAADLAAWPPDVFQQLVSAGILTPTANATSVVCDACGGDHVEEIIHAQSPSSGELRAYIRCPEEGRVAVPLERLRCWQVNYRCVADLSAEALATSGEVEEIVPSCVWLLGKTSLGGQPYELFLCRRLNGTNGAEVVQRAARLRASPQPVILAVGGLPDEAIWNGDIPLVLPLSALMAWDESRLSCDRAQLEVAIGKRRKAKSPAPIKSFPTPKGATWENVYIRMADLQIRVEVLGKRKELTFQEAGFEEKRRGNVPDRLWTLLRQLAVHGGILPSDLRSLPKKVRTNLKQNVLKLGKRLNALFLIDGNPFQDTTRENHCYATRFKIFAEEGLRFPTPEGLTWDGVSIEEVRTGVIAVRADAADVSGIYTAPDAEAEIAGRWEAAVQASVVERVYDLRSLGLADEDSNANPVGGALLAVLRGGGKVQRKSNDKAMLALGRRLGNLMQIDTSPFQFSKAHQMWSALFQASSVVPQPVR
jgi:hypothetical protein